LTTDPFDPGGLLRRLVDGGVRFVVIGDYAAQLHGSSLMTRDIDICYDREAENLDRLAAVLRDLDVSLRGASADLPFRADSTTLRNGDAFTLSSKLGPLDISATADAVGHRLDFEALERNAVLYDLGGYTVRVAAIDDLIAMKRAAGRTKDLLGVEFLGALRDEIDRGQSV
jgi:hypothetical protein